LADAVISVSEEEQVEGLARLGRRVGDRLRVVANGVDPMAFSPDGAIAARSSVPLVVCVGRLSRQKGQDVAIRALALARTPLVRLRLIGDGPERDRLLALATATGVRDRLEMTGNVTDPATHLRAADLVVIPSRWDGLSFSLLEAMACQRAVIATHVGGTGVLGPAGRLVPPDDPVQMARCMDDLLGDAAAREAMGRAGRALVERDYTRAESVRRTLDIWDEVTNPRACGPASNDARRRRIRRVRAPGR
jgi:glycosyltransferase involved in cell wall biosynthesis